MEITENIAFDTIKKRHIVVEFLTDLFPGKTQRYTVDKFVKVNDTLCVVCDFGNVEARRCKFFSFGKFSQVLEFLRRQPK